MQIIRNFAAAAVAIACLLPAVGSARAQNGISAEIAETGLAATTARLQSIAGPTADDRFALGGALFLRAIETALQEQYRIGLHADNFGLPVLRMPIASNPDPDPFDPGDVERIFQTLISDMALAHTALGAIPGDQQVSLPVALDDIWFDVDGDGNRSEGEGVVKLGINMLVPAWQRGDAELPGPAPTIRFDTADVAWLSAYTSFLAGFGEIVLALHPADAIEKVLDATAQMNDFRSGAPPVNPYDAQFGATVDLFSIIYLTLQQQPLAEHSRAAHGHFLEMIARNRDFWALADAETDNDMEWIPNARQVSALGIEVPADTSTRWQAVLNDAGALLNGELLVPYWRFGPEVGINLQKMFHDPAPVDIVEWIQGIGPLPFAEKGPLVTAENWVLFENMLSGNAMMFMVLLN